MCIFKGDSAGNRNAGSFCKSFQTYCCCLVAQSSQTICNPMDCSMPSFPVLHYLPGFAQTHVHWLSDIIQPSHPLSTPSPPAFSLSQHQGLFQWVSKWLKYWSFSFSTSPSNEYSGLISFRIDWFETYEWWLTTLLSLHLWMDLRLSLPWPFSLRLHERYVPLPVHRTQRSLPVSL